eukprot:gene3930-7140_t
MNNSLNEQNQNFILFGLNELTINFIKLLSKKEEKEILSKIFIVDNEDVLYEKYKKDLNSTNSTIFIKDFKEMFEKIKNLKTILNFKYLKKEEKVKLMQHCLNFEINFIDTNNEENLDFILQDESLNVKLKAKNIFFIFGVDSNLILFNLVSRFLNEKFNGNLKDIEFYHNSNDGFFKILNSIQNSEGELMKITNEKQTKISCLNNIKKLNLNLKDFKNNFVEEEFEEISFDENSQFFRGNLIPILSNEISTCYNETKIKNISSYVLREEYVTQWFKTKKNFEGILKVESKENEIDQTCSFLLDLLKNKRLNLINGIESYSNLTKNENSEILKSCAKLSFAFDQDLKFDFLNEKFNLLKNENENLKEDVKNLKNEMNNSMKNQTEMKNEIDRLIIQLKNQKESIIEKEETNAEKDVPDIKNVEPISNENKIKEEDSNDDEEEEDIKEEEEDDESEVDDDEEEEEDTINEKDEKDSKNEKIINRSTTIQEEENKGEKLENFQNLIVATAKEHLEMEKEQENIARKFYHLVSFTL